MNKLAQTLTLIVVAIAITSSALLYSTNMELEQTQQQLMELRKEHQRLENIECELHDRIVDMEYLRNQVDLLNAEVLRLDGTPIY